MPLFEHKILDNILREHGGQISRETKKGHEIYRVTSEIGNFKAKHEGSIIHFSEINPTSPKTASLLISLLRGTVEKVLKSKGITKIKVDLIPFGKINSEFFLKSGYKIDLGECEVRGIVPELAVKNGLILPIYKDL